MTTDSRAGWRIDPYGVERWWDGTKWQDERRPRVGYAVAPRPIAPAPVVPSNAAFLPEQRHVPQYAPQPQFVVAIPLKETGIAYVLAIFLGTLGIHRFYLGRTGSAIAMLALAILSGPAVFVFGLGLLGFAAVGIWWIVDLFLIPGIVREVNQQRLGMAQARGQQWR